MRSGYRAFALCSLAAAAILVVAMQSAQARPQYKSSFEKTYPAVAKQNGKNGKLTCLVCHPKKDKKMRNNYGVALKEAIGKKNEKNKDAIAKALGATEEKSSAIKGKTFGDLLAAGQLPASE